LRQIVRDNQIRPDLSTGKRKVVWLVDWEHVPYAVFHVAQRHNLKIDDLRIIQVKLHIGFRAKDTRWEGVYTTEAPCTPCKLMVAKHWLETKGYLGEDL
jgi:hypothetical protein